MGCQRYLGVLLVLAFALVLGSCATRLQKAGSPESVFVVAHADGCDLEPISTPPAPYPAGLPSKEARAVVHFAFLVSADGSVDEIRVFDNSTPAFIDQMVTTVKGWKFKELSCMKSDKGIWVRSSMEFKLDD